MSMRWVKGGRGRGDRGVALVLVLVAVTVASILSMGFLYAQTTTVGITQNIDHHAHARAIAESALAIAVAEVEDNASWQWRTDHPSGAWVTDHSFAGGTFSVSGEDGLDTDGDGVVEGDGDLADDHTDPVTLTATGRYQGATHRVVARLVPVPVTGGMQLLLIVSDAEEPEADDLVRKAQIEEWGYNVAMISHVDDQASFDAAVELSDVCYISETTYSYTLDGKLKPAPIGIVCEEVALHDELGVSSSRSNPWGTQIDITDNSHHILSPYATGPLTITNTNTRLNVCNGTIAGGVRVLAQEVSGSERMLLTIESAGDLYGGGVAVGRRVMLPWCVTAYNDFSDLTAEALDITKRAIEWVHRMDMGFAEVYSEQQGQVRHIQVATRVTLPQDAVLSSINAYIATPDDVRYAIYTDAGGEPGSLLVETDEQHVAGAGWFGIDLTPEFALNAGTYWLALHMGQDNGPAYRYTDTGGQTRHKDYDAGGGYLSSWGASDQTFVRSVSIFATGRPAAAVGISYDYSIDWTEGY